jgi:hypothetical protein
MGWRAGKSICCKPAMFVEEHMQNRIPTINLTEWTASVNLDPGSLARALEDGNVLYFPAVAFRLNEEEKRFLSPSWGDGRREKYQL